MALATLIIRWGGDASSDLLRRSARCTHCGNKGADLQHPSARSSDIALAFHARTEIGFDALPEPTSVCDGQRLSSKRICDETDSLMRVEGRRVRCAPLMLQLSPHVELNCLGCRHQSLKGAAAAH
jgi:hypothetical protein